MLKNYLLTAWKVFLNRKFFTFISLFGISLTVAVVMVAGAITESFIFPKGPEKNAAHYRIIDRLVVTEKGHGHTNASGLGYKFIKDNVMRLKSPELISINAGNEQVTLFLGSDKLTKTARRTDHTYWQILDFDFVEGRAFTTQEVTDGQMVAVINQTLAKTLFYEQSALNQTIELQEQRFTVIGVVEDVSSLESVASSDIWLPYTTSLSTAYQDAVMGRWQALLYHSNPNMSEEMYEEYAHLLQHDVELSHLRVGDGTKELVAYGGAYTKLENFSSRRFQGEYSYESGLESLILTGSAALVLFMMLPAMNMINLNVSRIMERSTEIGVRKAFGASTRDLIGQFLVENLAITAVGGVLGTLISFALLSVIEQSGLIPYAQFDFNWLLFLWAMLVVVILSLMSGLYPAYKMARVHPVQALKGVS